MFRLPGEDSGIDALILSKIDGCMSLRQMAQDLAAKFPLQFNSWEDALMRVGEVTAQCGERNESRLNYFGLRSTRNCGQGGRKPTE